MAIRAMFSFFNFFSFLRRVHSAGFFLGIAASQQG
jgi:hypothetical protein